MKNKLVITMFSVAVMGMAVQTTGFAAAGQIPSDTKTVSVEIQNVENTSSVKAYRIVKPVYNNEGFVRFTTIDGISISDIEAPTAAEVSAIAKSIASGSLTTEVYDMGQNGRDSSVQGQLPAGLYVVLVTDLEDAEYLYNPMVVSAYYTDANEADSLISSATLDAAAQSNFYVKRYTIPLDKEISDADGITIGDDDSEDGFQADELGIGDTASFKIQSKFPAYTEAFLANGVQYILNDTQDAGLDVPTNIAVYVDGTPVTAGNTTYQQTITDNDFKLDFASDYVIAHAGSDIQVTYQANLNENCTQGFTPNVNQVELIYTNSVTDKTIVTHKKDEVQEYTFPIEIKKVAAIDGKDTKGGQPLKGAEFTLTRVDAEEKTGINSFILTTGEDGKATFNRLDEGVYRLKETTAPKGYALNPDEFEVQIVPAYNEDGGLKQYTVTMKNISTDQEIGSVVIDSPDDDILAGNITDSRLQTLPATGGNGTKIFVLISCVLGSVTVTLYLLGKKQEKDKA